MAKINEQLEQELAQVSQELSTLQGQIARLLENDQQQLIKYLPKGANYRVLQLEDAVYAGLEGTKIYYVSDTSGGAVTRKLTFTNGILTSETA